MSTLMVVLSTLPLDGVGGNTSAAVLLSATPVPTVNAEMKVRPKSGDELQ